jgi:hypothetical protein
MEEQEEQMEAIKRAAKRRNKGLLAYYAAEINLNHWEGKLAQLVAPLYPDVDPYNISFGGHICENSPAGVCLYDRISDLGFECCLACGDPEERK